MNPLSAGYHSSRTFQGSAIQDLDCARSSETGSNRSLSGNLSQLCVFGVESMQLSRPAPRQRISLGGANACLCWVVLEACAAAAQSPGTVRRLHIEGQAPFPARSIRIVVPFPPGASTDAIARILAEPVSETFGQSVFVDNRSGAGGNVGAEVALRASADGHTWLLSTAGILTINPLIYPAMSFDPSTAFTPVTMLARVPYVLVVHPSIPVRSVPALIEFARRRPGVLNYGSAGNGSTVHLGLEMFKALNAIKIVHVPYRGGAPAMNDLLGGHIHMMFNSVPLALPYVSSGRVRPLAVSSVTRSEALPDLPTMQEAGVNGFEFTGWFAFLVPRRTPQRIVYWLNAELGAIVNASPVRSRLTAIGTQPVTSTPGQVYEQITRDGSRWQQVIRIANIKPDWEDFPQ
jgi:tripartite-type tricarboxylate transporter receptor subunit TctC